MKKHSAFALAFALLHSLRVHSPPLHCLSWRHYFVAVHYQSLAGPSQFINRHPSPTVAHTSNLLHLRAFYGIGTSIARSA
ncbi:hypothetical protein BD410DRAFT_797394, partial [Rickenella mellea]